MHEERSHTQELPVSSTLAGIGLRLSDWFERWFPDAFALALAAVAVVFTASAGNRKLVRADGPVVRRGLLGSRHVHDADVDDRGHRLRGRHVTAGLRSDQTACGVSEQRTECRGLRRPLLDAGVARVVELQPDLQRPARAGSRASRARRRLSRHRRRRVPRRRKRLGARPVFVGGAHHGVAGIAPGCDRAHQRSHPPQPDARSLAEHAHRCRAHRRLDGDLLLLGAGRGRSTWHEGDGRRVSARHAEDRHAPDPGRVARIQPVPDDRREHARVRVSDPGSRGQRSLDRPGAESLRLPVPDRRSAAALASAIVRAGDCSRQSPRSAGC